MFAKHQMSFRIGADNYSPLQQNKISNHFIIITILGADLCVNPENALVDLIE
jgi:hypothetical protein